MTKRELMDWISELDDNTVVKIVTDNDEEYELDCIIVSEGVCKLLG